jgi:ferritin
VERFIDFVNERSGRVILTAIEAPETEWDSPLSAFEGTLQHERKVTALINDLVELAVAEKDHAAQVFLQWFVTEQIEEESAAEAIVANLRLGGDSGVALLMLDKELSARALSPPPPAA